MGLRLKRFGAGSHQCLPIKFRYHLAIKSNFVPSATCYRRGEATVTGANNERQPVPASVREVLVRILTHMEEGQAITIIPASHDLTS